MTEEEYFRKTYPDFCYGDRPLSPYWDLFQYGVEFGERQSEKKIEELEQQIEKHKWNNIFLEDCAGYDKKIAEEYTTFHGRIKELEQQIEKMKCCENCKFKDCDKSNRYQTCWYCTNKDKWQLRR